MNSKVIGETIEDIASSITNSKWAKSIIPSVQELNQTIAHDSKMSAKWMDEKVQDEVKFTMEKLHIPTDTIDELSQSIHANTYEKDIDSLAESLSQYTDKVDTTSNLMKKKAKNIIDEGLDTVTPGLYDKITKYPQAYFKNPNKEIRNTRIGTAVGGYAALSVGGRYLQGGTLTTDEYGRKDIAGIPFL